MEEQSNTFGTEWFDIFLVVQSRCFGVARPESSKIKEISILLVLLTTT